MSALHMASPATQAPAAPPLSPFGAVSGLDSRSAPKQTRSAEPVAGLESRQGATGIALAEGISEAPSSAARPIPASSAVTSHSETATTLTEGALAKAPEADPSAQGAPNLESIRRAICSALQDEGHTSAADVLQAGTWSLDGASLRIEVGLGKIMIGLTVNPAAEKIIRQQLQRLGASTRFMVLPGEKTAAGMRVSTPVADAPAGSIQEAAFSHPLVVQAREIFKAEVRSVIDLRTK
jgi:DNA polymerase III subunit gamma/tau